MTAHRPLALVLPLFAALLLAACGGSGPAGSASLDPTPDPVPSPTPQEIAADILASCGLESIDAWLGDAETLRDLLEGTAPLSPAAFRLTGGNLLQARLDWAADLDGDMTDDVTGSIFFQDAQGEPTIPFSLTAFLALLAGDQSVDTLDELLATAPDGTRIRVTFVRAGPPVAEGDVTVTLVDGRVDRATGEVSALTTTGCEATVAFEDLPVAPLLGTWPAGSFAVDVLSPDHVVAADVVADGTRFAVATATLDGGAAMVYDIDLATGQVTPR